MSDNVQALPLPKVLPIWDPKHPSKYPPVIRVSMSDGNVINYQIDIPQPAPVLQKDLDRFTGTVFGYHAKRGNKDED